MKTHSRILLYYHTGTGNSYTAAGWIVQEAKSAGIPAEIHSIDKNYKPDPSGITPDTLIGFLYPTHGFNASPAMTKFIRKFPRGNCDVFTMNTRAGGKLFNWNTPGLSGSAQLLPLAMLIFKGYKIRGALPLDMPSNWISIHPGYPSKWIKFIFNKCRNRVTKFFARMLEGQKPVGMIFNNIVVDIAILPIALIYYFVGRYFLAKTFIYNNSCNDCNLCAENCPVNAIEIRNGKPYWKTHCESCMRCISYCPTKGVQSSHLLFFSYIGLIIGGFYLYKAYPVGALAGVNDYIIFLIINLLLIPVVFGMYMIIQRLMEISFIEKVFRYTSLTNFWRRYRAPGTKVKNFKM